VPVGPLLAAAGVPGADQLVAGDHMRLWPHLHGTDGFFAAVWQQKP
jgi:16S rRNA (cytosine967-C5)-methyltransferase